MPAKTPMFPGWAALAGRASRSVLTRALEERLKLARRGLCGMAALLQGWLDPALLAPAPDGPGSRRRVFDTATTFHAFLWQVLDGQAACREAVQQVQLACAANRSTSAPAVLPCGSTSAYCQARGRLHTPLVTAAAAAIARRMHTRALDSERWLGREVKLIDATGVSMDDTAESREVFGTPTGQKPGCGFPVMKLCAMFTLTTGAWLAHEYGRTYDHDLSTAVPLLKNHLHPGDVLAADRAYSAWWVMALAIMQGADCVLRLHQARRADFRRGRALGKGDRLLSWPKPARPAHCPLGEEEYAALPDALEVRMVRSTNEVPGQRVRSMVLVTTLRDAVRYPAAALGEVFRRRWQIELNFDDIKTTLGMNHLACQSVEMALRMVRMYQCAYNLIRALMQQSAHASGQCLYRLSFKGTATLLSSMPLRVPAAGHRRAGVNLLELLATLIAGDPVPLRPGRHEPRAIKRRHSPYPLLTAPRKLMKTIPHQKKYRKSTALTLCLS
jgi:hypothetical protein